MVMVGRAGGVGGSRGGWSGGARARCSVGPPIGFCVTAVMMGPVAVMHENVHQWTGRQEQPRQPGQNMRPVLGKQKKGADYGKSKQHELHSRTASAFVVPSFSKHGRVLVHNLQLAGMGIIEVHFRRTRFARQMDRHLNGVGART